MKRKYGLKEFGKDTITIIAVVVLSFMVTWQFFCLLSEHRDCKEVEIMKYQEKVSLMDKE